MTFLQLQALEVHLYKMQNDQIPVLPQKSLKKFFCFIKWWHHFEFTFDFLVGWGHIGVGTTVCLIFNCFPVGNILSVKTPIRSYRNACVLRILYYIDDMHNLCKTFGICTFYYFVGRKMMGCQIMLRVLIFDRRCECVYTRLLNSCKKGYYCEKLFAEVNHLLDSKIYHSNLV